MDWNTYYKFPIPYRIWLIKRINEEIKKSAEKQNDIPAKGAHNNTPDIRALTGKTRTQTPAKLQRFT